MRWLPGQLALFRSRAKRKCLRSGNQATGKTTAGIAEAIWRATGSHPYRDDLPKGPTRGIIVGATHEQTKTIQGKFWNLVDKRLLVEGCVYDEAKGAFVGKHPTIRFKNGSIIHIASAEGNALSVAGKTLDWVWIDEPFSKARLYEELKKRLLRTGGDLWMTFTPVNARVDWIKEECEEGRIQDLWYPITLENLRLDDGSLMTLEDGSPCDQAWLDALIADTAEYERPVTIEGEWEMRFEGALWKHYRDSGPSSHVVALDALVGDDWDIHLGIDHGDREFAACASLVAVDRGTIGKQPHIAIVAEWYSDGSTTTEENAKGILAMVDEYVQGGWGGLAKVRGDIPHGGSKRKMGRRDNVRLSNAIARQMGVKELPVLIDTVRKPPGSVQAGWRLLHYAMLEEGALQVVDTCAQSRLCLRDYDGKPNTDLSHQIDAIRYALQDEILDGAWQGRSPTTIYVR